MPEHAIRLRGGWEWQDLDQPAEPPRRQTLPFEWSPAPVGPIRLIRRFNRPPLDPDRESVSIRLEQVPGLIAIELNGRLFDVPMSDSLSLDLGSFGPAQANNRLVLEVDPARAARGGELWGQVALVIVDSGANQKARSDRSF